ncbi:MAG: RNA-binding S4 domain-containing protein [Devosiaceae bacterium]|nr:RNA-binding S4 domain-containing protein [Devosiaceae bacterium]
MPQRLDKWLWFTRVTKTRSLAQKLIREGGVRIDGTRSVKTSQMISRGAVLTIAYADSIRILKMIKPGTRRGPANEAQVLYEDLSPPAPPKKTYISKNPRPTRDPGSGRPTKKQRRETDRLLQR